MCRARRGCDEIDLGEAGRSLCHRVAGMAEPRSAPADDAGGTWLARSLQDPDAFADFYAHYVERVSVFFVRRVFDPEVAVDLTAETFALALECRARFRGTNPEQEQGWLFGIAKNLLNTYWRKGHSEQAAVRRLGLERTALGTEDLEYLHHRAGLEELRARLATTLEAVTSDQAAAITARVLHERDYADIASEFQTSPDVIRARVSRGLRTMHRLLGDTIRHTVLDT
jgi:RNA polymerase sigma factor (sigma-70 family)